MIIQYNAFPIITSGNFPFRDKVIIDTLKRVLTYQKRCLNIIGNINRTIRFCDITEVQLIHRWELFTFSTVNIITIGGSIINITGLRPADGKGLKFVLDNMR